MSKSTHIPLLVLLSLVLLLIDQTAKWLALRTAPVEFNSGIAFGFGQGKFGSSGISIWIMLSAILVLLLDFTRRQTNLPDMLIITGGISNIIDRLYRKSVLDWIHLDVLWFNLADIYISIGIIWIILKKIREIRSVS